MAREYPTVLDLVGHTPLARLQRIVPEDAATVLAKLEYISPGGSVKDRIGIKLIEEAERSGEGGEAKWDTSECSGSVWRRCVGSSGSVSMPRARRWTCDGASLRRSGRRPGRLD